MSNMTIDEAIERVNEIFPYLKPMSYVRLKSLYVFQMAQHDGTPIHFDNLIAIDRSSGMPFPFNPLKFGKEYAKVANNFVTVSFG